MKFGLGSTTIRNVRTYRTFIPNCNVLLESNYKFVKGNRLHFYLEDIKFGYVSLSVDSHQYSLRNFCAQNY